MSELPPVSSSLELNGFEKLFCLHGNWLTVCHCAHLVGDSMTATDMDDRHFFILSVNAVTISTGCLEKNTDQIIYYLLRKYTRVRSRLRIEGYKHYLELLEYDEQKIPAGLFHSVVHEGGHDGQGWQSVIDKQCNKNPYSADGSTVFPLFHFVLILNKTNPHSFRFALFSNHCTSDGQSGYILLNEFLRLSTLSPFKLDDVPVSNEVLPCVSDMVERPLGPLFSPIAWIGKRWFRSKMQEQTEGRIPVKTLRNDDTRPNSYPVQPVLNKFLFATSRPGLVPDLRSKCRDQKMTLHGPLLASLLLTAHIVFPRKGRKEKGVCTNRPCLDNIDIATEVDMRRRLPRSGLKPTNVGFYVGSTLLHFDTSRRQYPLTSTTVWKLALECVDLTRKAVTGREVGLTTHMFRNIIGDERVFTELASLFPDGRMGELNFSNVGEYPFAKDYNNGQIKVQGMHAFSSSNVYSQTIALFVSSAGDDGHLDFTLVHELETEELAELFFSTYLRIVELWPQAEKHTTLQAMLMQAQST